MTVQEATKLVYMFHAAYPQDRKATEEDLLDRVDLWAVFFADYPGDLVMKIGMAWIRSFSYMPTPEEIKRNCDTHRQTMKLLAQAGTLDDIHLTSEQDRAMDELWEALTDAEEEGAKT